MIKALDLAIVGCGARAVAYMSEAATDSVHYRIAAAADPKQSAVDRIGQLSGYPGFRGFDSAEALLREDKLADVLFICTQDRMHFGQCRQALRQGYDIVLEKPISTELNEVVALETLAVSLGRRVLVCHVLRYAPIELKIKELLESGVIGDIVTLNASSGTEPWHHAHSYVRGKWADTSQSAPFILAKCCHDLDLISWYVKRRCESVSSFGSLSYFKQDNAPGGAPLRCTDGCPVAESCYYNAARYCGGNREPWLPQVFEDARDASEAEILEWLKTSPWGRCVYRCENDAVDHQVVALRFEGDLACTFTATAFDDGRNLQVCGTLGQLLSGASIKAQTGHDILLQDQASGQQTGFDFSSPEESYIGHDGGDHGLIKSLYREMIEVEPAEMHTSITKSLESHYMAFAAEISRQSTQTVNICEMLKQTPLVS